MFILPLFSKGIILEQHKEPALSKNILQYPSEPSFFANPYPYSEFPSIEQLTDIARRANIIDEHDGALLADKLSFSSTKGHPVGIIADALDDDPYISSQLALALHQSDLISRGLHLCAVALKIKSICIMVYKNIYDLSIQIPTMIKNINVVRIKGKYPAENRIDNILGKSKRKLIIGTGALLHLARAVDENRIQTTCFVTVSGNCIAKPANVEFPIGLPVSSALDFCTVALDPTRVVVGGSMTGKSILDPSSELLTANSRAVLAFEDRRERRAFNCIGCSRCTEVCPQELAPFLIYKYTALEKYDELYRFDVARCDECGSCSYVCPAELDLADYVIKGKNYILKKMSDSGVTSASEQQDLIHRKNLKKLKKRRMRFVVITDISDSVKQIRNSLISVKRSITANNKTKKTQEENRP